MKSVTPATIDLGLWPDQSDDCITTQQTTYAIKMLTPLFGNWCTKFKATILSIVNDWTQHYPYFRGQFKVAWTHLSHVVLALHGAEPSHDTYKGLDECALEDALFNITRGAPK